MENELKELIKNYSKWYVEQVQKSRNAYDKYNNAKEYENQDWLFAQMKEQIAIKEVLERVISDLTRLEKRGN